MKKITVIALALACAGCGAFQLGYVRPMNGQDRARMEQDMLFCKDYSRTATETTERQVGSFVAGLTIVGAPIAIQSARQKQREEYASCMRQRGYTYEPPRPEEM